MNNITSHWFYNNEILEIPPHDMAGFVYMITNMTNQKKYIGRKYFGKYRRVKKSGSTRRKIIRSDSDWKEYIGSSDELKKDIEILGKDKFKFEILIMGRTRGQVNFLEETTHHKMDVILRDDFYNLAIGPRRFMNINLQEDIKLRLGDIVKNHYINHDHESPTITIN